MRGFGNIAMLSVVVGACQLDPRVRAVEQVTQEWVAAAAANDSLSASGVSVGVQPWRAAQYVRWLRPDFLSAATNDARVGWSPSFHGDRAMLALTVAYRGREEKLHVALTRQPSGWAVSRVDVGFEGSRPGDPEVQPNFSELREEHGFAEVRRR